MRYAEQVKLGKVRTSRYAKQELSGLMIAWLVWILLIATYGLVWTPWSLGRLPLWGWALCGLVLFALSAGLMQPVALLWLGLAATGAWLWGNQAAWRPWLWLPLVIFLLAFGVGLLPGFVRVELLAPEPLGRSPLATGLQMSLAKPLLGLLILVLALAEPQRHLRLIGALRAWRLWFLPAVVVLLCAWLLGGGARPKVALVDAAVYAEQRLSNGYS